MFGNKMVYKNRNTPDFALRFATRERLRCSENTVQIGPGNRRRKGTCGSGFSENYRQGAAEVCGVGDPGVSGRDESFIVLHIAV